MKLSSNSIGMLIFTALATAVFVLMVLRPAVDGNAMNLGVPMSNEKSAAATTTETTATEAVTDMAEEKKPAKDETPEESLPSEEPLPNDTATEKSEAANTSKDEVSEEAPTEVVPTTN